MTGQKKIIAVINDMSRNVAAVRLEGNKTFTSIATAVRMAESGKIDAVPVHPKKGNPHIRSKPDGNIKNNLVYMAR